MKELERIRNELKGVLEEIDSFIMESENGAQKRSKREAALLDEVEKLRAELDKSQKAFEGIKEEAVKAMDVATELLHEKEELEKSLKELKEENAKKAQKVVVAGKYRQHEEKPVVEPKKGFRIKED